MGPKTGLLASDSRKLSVGDYTESSCPSEDFRLDYSNDEREPEVVPDLPESIKERQQRLKQTEEDRQVALAKARAEERAEASNFLFCNIGFCRTNNS